MSTIFSFRYFVQSLGSTLSAVQWMQEAVA